MLPALLRAVSAGLLRTLPTGLLPAGLLWNGVLRRWHGQAVD